MELQFGLALKEYVLSREMSKPEWLIPCSGQEIENARHAQQVEFLPQIYKEFLSVMGRGVGPNLLTDWDFTCVEDHKDIAKGVIELTTESVGISIDLPQDAFVFATNKGMAFLYFMTASRDEDPAIFFYMEGNKEITFKSPHFSIWIYEFIDTIHKRRLFLPDNL